MPKARPPTVQSIQGWAESPGQYGLARSHAAITAQAATQATIRPLTQFWTNRRRRTLLTCRSNIAVDVPDMVISVQLTKSSFYYPRRRFAQLRNEFRPAIFRRGSNWSSVARLRRQCFDLEGCMTKKRPSSSDGCQVVFAP